MNIGDKYILAYEIFQELLEALRDRNYQVIGPTVRDNAIVYDEISSISELPSGLTDEQDGGSYRLKKRDDNALFGYALGPHSWKKFLHPPVMSLWKANRTGDEIKILEEKEETKKEDKRKIQARTNEIKHPWRKQELYKIKNEKKKKLKTRIKGRRK